MSRVGHAKNTPASNWAARVRISHQENGGVMRSEDYRKGYAAGYAAARRSADRLSFSEAKAIMLQQIKHRIGELTEEVNAKKEELSAIEFGLECAHLDGQLPFVNNV